MFDIGLSTNWKIVNEDLFKKYSSAGIKYMEVVGKYEEVDTFDWKLVTEWAKKYNVTIRSYHLPFMPFDVINIASESEELRKQSVEILSGLIKQVSAFGIKLFVIHPSGEPISDELRDVCISQAKKSLLELCEVASQCNSVLAVEDLPRSCLGRCSTEILDLISVDDRLRICFDTNHVTIENLKDFILAVGDRIVNIHVSDFDFAHERHWLPFEGKINWQEIYETLVSVGYNGPWLYEIRFDCPGTIMRPRDLTCEDFVENANCIFENKPYKTICKHYEKLGRFGPIKG